jgi:hypothetical protein
VLGIKFGLKWDEMTVGWKKLLKKELHNLYSLSTAHGRDKI